MSDAVQQTPNPTPEASAVQGRSLQDKKALRRKTAKFVVVFVISVFVLLAGYDLAKYTKANDWYLLQVARSTAWLLRGVAYSCTVGNPARYRGREVEIRRTLDAWRRGEDAPPSAPNAPTDPSAPDAAPLTLWETWEYQATGVRRVIAEAEKELEQMEADATLSEPERTQRIDAARARVMQMKQRDIGPLVQFLLKPGLARRLADAEARVADLQQDTTLDDETRAQRIAEVQAEVAKLEQEVQAAQSVPPSEPRQGRDVAFNFIVIPDCGAVQSMAIFLSAILAFPSRWWKRLVGMVVGLPILYWVNAFRLAFLAVIGAWDSGGKWFKFSHEYIWQGIYIVFVVALWMSWVEFLVRRRS
jgi:exosortase/archaeosortase family protein